MKCKNLILLNSLSFFIYILKKNSHFNHPPPPPIEFSKNSDKLVTNCASLPQKKKDNNTTLGDAADLLLCFELVHGSGDDRRDRHPLDFRRVVGNARVRQTFIKKKQRGSATETSGALTVRQFLFFSSVLSPRVVSVELNTMNQTIAPSLPARLPNSGRRDICGLIEAPSSVSPCDQLLCRPLIPPAGRRLGSGPR